MIFDYETLKEISKGLRQQGIKVGIKEMLALAPGNDPFYVGAPSQRRDAEWFAEVYNRVGGAHLRRVHYRILDLPASERRLPVPLTTKDKDTGRDITFEHYENYERCWDWLNNASKYARYLGLVAIDAFTDNRAKEDSFRFYSKSLSEAENLTPSYEVADSEWAGYLYQLPELPALDRLPYMYNELPDYRVTGYSDIPQRYHIEIWVEKSEGEDVILPLCEKYGIDFVPGVGDMSITTTYRFCQRVRRSGKPARLLYISDFDPSGFNMPIAVARKVEHMVRVCGFGDLDITLEPIMLTYQQVQEYSLPTAPVKDSDGRKDRWEMEYGGAVELNAMFARDERIEAARRIIEAAILKYYDTGLQARAFEQRRALVAALRSERNDIIARYENEWGEVREDYEAIRDEWQEVITEFDELVEPFRARLESFRERIEDINRRGATIFENVTNELEDTDIDPEEDYPIPEPAEVEITNELYFSQRDYWTQLNEYYAHKLNGVGSSGEWLDLLKSGLLTTHFA